MLVAETCLLEAVRDRLRAELDLTDNECGVQIDNELPAISGKAYFAVTAAGATPGERHESSGLIWDFRYAVRVTVFQRITDTARDRRGDVSIDLIKGVNQKLDKVIIALDNNQDLRQAAEANLTGTTAAGGEFPEPFRSFQADTNSKPVFRDPYDAATMQANAADPIVALARGVTFVRMRFMKVKD